MKIKKYAKYLFETFVLFVIVTIPLLAKADSSFDQPVSISNPFNCGGQSNCTLLTLLTTILDKIIMPIAAVACVFWVILAGFKYVQAKGNPAKVQEAHQNLLWALIGVGVILAATGISAVLQATVKSFLN